MRPLRVPLLIGLLVASAVALCTAHRLQVRRTDRVQNPMFRLTPISGVVRGTVREVLRAGPYSYHRILLHGVPGSPDALAGSDPASGGSLGAFAASSSDERWVVSLGSGAPVGARVSGRVLGERSDFPSRRLGRTFPRLLFAQLRIELAHSPRAAASIP